MRTMNRHQQRAKIFNSRVNLLTGLLVIALVASPLVAANIAKAFPQNSTDVSSSLLSTQMTSSTQIEAIVRQAATAWMQKDAEGFASLFTSDGEFIVPGNCWSGQAAIRDVAAEFAQNAAEVKIEIRQILIDGNRAAVEWHWQDTEKATDRRNQADDVIMIDFANGQISRWREYIDTQTPNSQTSTAS